MKASNILSVSQLIRFLRQNGDLDESVLARYKTSKMIKNIVFFTLLILSLLCTLIISENLFWFIAVAVLSICLWVNAVRHLSNLFLLYTIGMVTDGQVLAASLRRVGGGINTYDYSCRYFDNNGNQFDIKF